MSHSGALVLSIKPILRLPDNFEGGFLNPYFLIVSVGILIGIVGILTPIQFEFFSFLVQHNLGLLQEWEW